jgi:formylglycine-generating enzyme required for sulfatase activity
VFDVIRTRSRIEAGDSVAAEQFLSPVIGKLKKLAANATSERPRPLLRATASVLSAAVILIVGVNLKVDGQEVAPAKADAGASKPLAAPPSKAPATASPADAIVPFDADEAKTYQQTWADHLGVPAEYTNSIGMKFVLIPPGEFMMGSTPEEAGPALRLANNDHWRQCVESESPKHQAVLTQPFYLGVYEVTQAQYERVMRLNPGHFAATGGGANAVLNVDTGDYPIESVTWVDAAEFSAKLSKLEKLKPFYSINGDTVTMLDGGGYRLPSEAEWEFACRAGTTTTYSNGDNDQALVNAAWVPSNSQRRTHPVGRLQANAFGLFDMHGNAWEWVEDGWQAGYYEQFVEQPAIDPRGPSADTYRVLRGGGWAHHVSHCRSPARLYDRATNRNANIGFRIALPPVAVGQSLAKDASSQ